MGREGSKYGRERSIGTTTSEEMRARFDRLKEESAGRMGMDELFNDEFVALLLDVFELHLEQEHKPLTRVGQVTFPEWIECYCAECEEKQKHDASDADKKTGVVYYRCVDCGANVVLNLTPIENDD